MNINTFDLNLLRIFDAVIREENITAAGAQLGLTQSAVSHALRRLRALCNDPLFVRTTLGMRPTPYAQTLAVSVSQSLGNIRNALDVDLRFDPATSTREFKLLTTDIAEFMLYPRLMSHIKHIAPRVSLISSQMERVHYRDALESGAADLAIGRLPEKHQDFHQQHLFDEPLVCMMRRDFPKIGRKISLQQFMDAAQVTVSEPAQVERMVKRVLGKRAARRRITLHVPHYVVVPMILMQNDFIAVLPRGVGAGFLGRRELKALPLPFKLAPVQVRQFWHERSHHDAGHRWLRSLIAKLFMR